jgi:hypothetical protein
MPLVCWGSFVTPTYTTRSSRIACGEDTDGLPVSQLVERGPIIDA